MIKNLTLLEVKKGDKTFQLHMDPQSTLGEVFDAIVQMREYVVNRILQSAKEEEKKEEKSNIEVPKEFTE